MLQSTVINVSYCLKILSGQNIVNSDYNYKKDWSSKKPFGIGRKNLSKLYSTFNDIYIINILPLFWMHGAVKHENDSQLSAARIVSGLPIFVFIKDLTLKRVGKL